MPPSIRALPAFPPNLIKRNQGDCFVTEEVRQDLLLLGSNRKRLSEEVRFAEAESNATDAADTYQAPREPPVSKTLLNIFCTFLGRIPMNER